MAGLIGTPMVEQQKNVPQMPPGKIDPMLQKVIDGIEERVQNKDAYGRIVVAGLKLIFSKNTNKMLLDGIDQVQDVATWAGEGIAGVLGMLTKQSKGTMPFEPMVAAGATMLMHALDFLSQLGRVELSNEVISTATKAYAMAIIKSAGVSEDQLIQMGSDASAAIQDPQKAEMIKQHLSGGQNNGTD